ncbi:hypothetical protein NHX12_012414 [Muraenolepis orangiensis]|uniref:Sushi domain-containing protein n=1 Tax=Muraenolepis orangiensis TaxID=630683 RepID=A0A9Q0DCZ1_9TELE|nr:hypothetical protein NHX12_012414 [Muraenolepis orangiensis]
MLRSASRGQCPPMPLPSLGTQRIIQGNGTSVGTVISLQCPVQHTLMGGSVVCVRSTDTTPRWVGETYCTPLSASGEFGFRVAMLASVVSSAIILLLTMAFITCCLHERFKDKKKKRRTQKREARERLEWTDNPHHHPPHHHHPHHSRNNNNNNSSSQKGDHDAALVGDKAPRGCGPYCDPTVPSSTPLPGKGYGRPPVSRVPGPDPDLSSLYLQNIRTPAPHEDRPPPLQMGRGGAPESGPARSSAGCLAEGHGAGVAHRAPLVTHPTSRESYGVNSTQNRPYGFDLCERGHGFDVK